ncbi:Pvc16 family protein [Agarilytica rhodophyticola]|uniref:Pvc16 family protein n=1 Tax=Agarilytica rhodophyticola TaxID=1737490 RepID=UPI000B342C8B|nr:Pvc16 family protein [Agarilytica rhodophyticola]
MDPLILQKLQQALKAFVMEKIFAFNVSGNSIGIEINFLAPNSEFVTELGNNPVVNCYLIGVMEDKVRRKSESHRSIINAQKTQRVVYREPRFIDLNYMITIWCKDKQGSAEIEHLVLGYLLSGLGSFDFMPEEMLERFNINISPFGVRFTLFGTEHSDKISGQIWQAMGSTPKPCLMLSLSVPIDVHEPTHVPIVQEIERLLGKK